MAYARLIQIHQGMSASYEVVSNERIIATARVPHNINSGEILYIEDDNVKYRLKRDLKESLKNITRKNTDKNLIQYSILNEYDDKVGVINSRVTKGFLKSYEYEEINIYDRHYFGYGIGFGKEGYKYPIYEKEKQIALIEKDNVVVDKKDIYDIYTLDEELIELAVLYCLRLDMIAFANNGEYAIKSKEVSYTYTWNKELKSKYNPEFKRGCI